MIATATATTVTAQSAAADPYVDEILKSDFYGPILDEMKLSDEAVSPIDESCCDTLKMWGDIGLFAGRFDQSEHQHNGRPVYRAAAGELKVFFNAQLNRWTVSDEVHDRVQLRAIGQGNACPDASDWLVWDGTTYVTPDTTEPWAPYVVSEQMFECRIVDFSVDMLKRQIGDKLCTLLQSEKGVASGRFCREGEKIAQMIFAEWDESTTNSFLNVNLAMVLDKVKSLDQWHSVVNSILIKRTFDTEPELVNQIRSYIRMIVSDVRENYQNSAFAEEDSRFLFLKV